jgi:hypothetical protein
MVAAARAGRGRARWPLALRALGAQDIDKKQATVACCFAAFGVCASFFLGPGWLAMDRLLACLIATGLLVALAEGFTSPVVVVGKVIIDEYGDPAKRETPALSIGGGGPQAAFGAACGLAVRDCFDAGGTRKMQFDTSSSEYPLPPCMPVAFLGAVGKDWSDNDTGALHSLIGAALDTSPVLIKSEGHMTPRIRLWHDQSQNIQWYAVNDSFGPSGADGLWRNCPSASDLLAVLDERDDIDEDGVALHMIVESGEGAAGGGLDSEPLRNSELLERTSFVGVEPIAFINEEEGKVSAADAASCVRLIESLPRLDVLCPDNDLDSSLQELGHDRETFHIVARNGPKGSILYESGTGDGGDVKGKRVPAATLRTSDGNPVNPTGAGNAYSGALSALLGTGSDLLEAATIATGVGAAVCEFKNLPPWNWETLERIRDARDEVREKLSTCHAYWYKEG